MLLKTECQRLRPVVVKEKFDIDVVHKNRKLENETENFKHEHVTHEFKIELQKARLAKNMSQQQLANRINVKQTIIQEYENGKAIPDNNIISKINNILGVKLRK